MKIVWNSFHGRFSDNPRALWERLADRPDLDHTWLADPAHAATFPSTVRTVDITGPDAVEALESCDLLVANTHTEVDWVKRPGTTYVQTWHGTPLKRIHRDVLWAPEGRLDRLDEDVAKWDLLLSPNQVSTPRLRHAFRYSGEVLESGYPRNDLLSDPERELVDARLRAELDIAEDATVVLYTPTWRDDEVFADGGSEIPLVLDVAQLADALGPGYVVLLRVHYMVTGRARAAQHPGVRDVSFHPDIRELYCLADALVTDYSSTMFDFAVTGRPILFYAYDLDRFQESVRGFYFDFVPSAPGPVLRTGAELIEALRDLDAHAAGHAERYAAFRDTYTSLEDGHAADRVLARLGLAADGSATPSGGGPAERQLVQGDLGQPRVVDGCGHVGAERLAPPVGG